MAHTAAPPSSLQDAVLEAAAHLYVWALKDIPQDLRDALAAARDRETSKTGIRVLETIHRNVEIADEQKNLVCQDTGIAVYYCRVGGNGPVSEPQRAYTFDQSSWLAITSVVARTSPPVTATTHVPGPSNGSSIVCSSGA